MQPFPIQDDDRPARVLARIVAMMKASSGSSAETEAAEWIDFIMADIESRRKWWFLENVVTATLNAGNDLIDLKGDVEKVSRVFCPWRLTKRSLSEITEARTIAINGSYSNASNEVNDYALEAGKRIHLWPAPAQSVEFGVLYQRPMALEIVPGKLWEMMVLNGVIAYFAQHFDRDALVQNVDAFEARYEAQILRAVNDGHDIELAGYWDDKLPASSTVVADSTTETATDSTAPASLIGIGHECIYTLTVPLGTIWDIVLASYDAKSLDVSGQESNPRGLSFKPDGSKVYVVGSSNKVFEHSLYTAWDLSTASYDNKSFSVLTEVSFPNALFFKPDGTKVYITGGASDSIYQYSLSNAWDISTMSYDSKFFSLGAIIAFPTSMFFTPDGLKVFIVSGDDSIYQYSLTSAWDIETAVYDNKVFNQAEDTTPLGLFFKPDGTRLFVIGSTNDRIYQYDLATAWDISTAVYNSEFFSVASEGGTPTDLFFRPDGTQVFTIDDDSDAIFQYSL